LRLNAVGKIGENMKEDWTYVLVVLILVTGTISMTFPVMAVEGGTNGEMTSARLDQEQENEFEYVQGYFTKENYSVSEKETSIEVEHKSDNYSYRWEYSEDSWTGDTEYIDEYKTTFLEDESEWIINAAVDHNATIDEEWIVNVDGEEYDARVVEADTGLAKSGSLDFTLDPYTEGATDMENITMSNDGNVPGRFEIEIDHLEGLDAETESEVVEPEDSEEIEFTFRYDTLGHEEIELEQFVIRTFTLGRLDLEADGNVVVESEIQYGETPSVSVKYDHLDVDDEPANFTIQYENELSNVERDSIQNATFYLFPEEEINYSLNGENIFFSDDDVEVIIHGTEESPDSILEREYDPTETLSPDYNKVEITVVFRTHHEEEGIIELIVDGEKRYDTTVDLELAEFPDENGDDDGEEDGTEDRIYLGIGIVAAVLIFGVLRSTLLKKVEGEEESKEENSKRSNSKRDS